MIKNDFMLQRLKDKISDYDDFVLYGAGHISQLLIKILAEGNSIPQYCVVSNMSGDLRRIEKIDIYMLDQKAEELREKNILVIIAVSSMYETEIINLLRQTGIDNIVPISEYCCNLRMFNEFYLEKDFEWYLLRIKNWYYECNGTALKDPLLQKRKDEGRNDIVLVLDHPSPRAVKIIKALKGSGKQITVLVNGRVAAEPIYSLWCNYLKEICMFYYYNWIEELIFLLLKNRGSIIHVFSTPGNIYAPYILTRLQNNIGKIVFDEYDIVNGFYTKFDERTLQLERYCLENAAGICYREFSLEYLTGSLKFDIKGKTVRFFDYCSEKNENNCIEHKEDELSLCYAGGVVMEEEYSNCPFSFSMAFIEMCEKNRCHLHIYPSGWDEKRYRKYIEKDRGSRYFHFHKPVVYNELRNELSQYDYGIIPTRDDIWEREISGYNTKYKYIYAASNKLFDYIDAGLPIISAQPLKMAEYLEEMGVLIKWTNGNYDFEYLMLERENMKNKVVKARERLQIENHIGELLQFYASL